MFRRIQPATAIASAALFLSLGGVGMAASHYVITSISQIKPSVRHALRDRRGERGPVGPQGPQAPIPTVDLAHSSLAESSATLTAAQPSADLTATCPTGQHVLTGGFKGSNETTTVSALVTTALPYPGVVLGKGWQVTAHLEQPAASGDVQAWALCEGPTAVGS